MEPLNEKSQIAQEYGLLPADAQQQKFKLIENERGLPRRLKLSFL